MQDRHDRVGDQQMDRVLEYPFRMIRRLARLRPLRRLTALGMVYLLLHSQGVMVFQALRAETAGATAPEVTKFEPADTTDLVNLATGDFNYTIPVINVPGPEGGYPLTLGYHAGIPHGEEASWVGLGWNLQPGSISRGVHGYPDDFNGVGISTNYLSNVYETYSLGVSWMGVQVGVSYTSYIGYSGYIGYSIGLGYSFGNAEVHAGLSAVMSFSKSGTSFSVTANVGASVGIGPVSVGADCNTDLGSGKSTTSVSMGISDPGSRGSRGPYGTGGLSKAGGSQGKSGSASYSSYSEGGNHSETFGIGLSIAGFGISASYTRSWIDKTEYEHAYGYYYHASPADNRANPNGGVNEDYRVNEWTMESDPKVVPGDSKEHALAAGLHYLPSNDGYAVMGQGTGGSLKLTRREDRVYRPRRLKDEWTEFSAWPWAGVSADNQRPRFVFDGDNTESLANPDSVGLSADKLALLVKTPTDSSTSQLTHSDISSSSADFFLGKAFQKGSRVVKERMSGSHFSGFDVWESDGKHYVYNDPVWNWNSTSISANRNVIGTGEWFRSKSIISEPYAYAWYLSALKYPDYLDDGTPGLSDGDKGGWVKFNYLVASHDYRWHSSSDGQLNDGPLNRIDKLGKDKAGMMYNMQYGSKQLKYPSSIETATHKAYFSVSNRMDAREIQPAKAQRSATVLVRDLGGGVFELETNNLSLLGVHSENPLAWEYVSGVMINKICGPPRAPEDEQETYPESNPWVEKVVASQKAMDLMVNGVPLVATDVTRTSVIEGYFGDDPYNSTNKCYWFDTKRYVKYVVRVTIPTQFWSLPIDGVSNPYADIKSKWAALSTKPSFTIDAQSMMKLDDIYLIEKSTKKLVKQVHFNYSYRLAPGTPNSDASATTPENVAFGVTAAKGKLTLESVQTYGQGGSADTDFRLPPHRFTYANNPSYGSKYSYDRWGFHKSDGGPWRHRDTNAADQSAWCLSKITLPTGGEIHIQYEPKDYARVQDRIPLNPRANQGIISNYMVDLTPWVTTTAWPVSPSDWADFRTKVLTTPFRLFPPNGTAEGTIPRAVSTLPHSLIPIQSAPNPVDLKLWLKAKSEAYRSNIVAANNLTVAGAKPMEILQEDSVPVIQPGMSIPDKASPMSPAQAIQVEGASPKTVERMVNLVFEYWTSGSRPKKRLGRPLKSLDPQDIGAEGDDDRGDVLIRSVLVRMKKSADNGVDLFVVDPDFDWPKDSPSAMYVTWTANPATPKLGGGVRVKRIVSFDGRRSFTTGYAYTDLVNGTWTTSGVAAQEPPPFGYSSDDDRVIQTEKGGWANEVGGGIYHSRVIVRHSWSENPLPAGIRQAGADGFPTGTPVQTPMGETIFRFITPADLPHRQRDVESTKTVWKDGNGVLHLATPATPVPSDTSLVTGLYTNSVRLTEIMNVGSWWGKLLWKEDRDKTGKPLNRVENYYTQLEGYLRLFQSNEMGHATGFDPDVEKAWDTQVPRDSDMSYAWAPSSATAPNLPRLVNKDGVGGTIGVDLPTGSLGYLNTSVNVTVLNATTNLRRPMRFRPSGAWKTDGPPEYDDPGMEDPFPTGWHSSISAVRELNIPPVVSEVRTYGEGLKLLGVTRSTKWDARTGVVMEAQSQGRKTSAGYEWLVNRTWPAYWVYGGMDTSPLPNGDWTGLDAENYAGRDTIKNMLTQTAQVTTSRLLGSGAEVFLNSKVDTWWQPEANPNGRWMKGGEFVWNGQGTGLKPIKFKGFDQVWNPNWIAGKNWITELAEGAVVGLQPYKASPDNWIFAGATTGYDAYAHALEAVDGDGVYGCSKYGYPYTDDGKANLPAPPDGVAVILPAGTLPVAKFANARNAETLYWNFEGPSPNAPGMSLSALTPAVIGNPMQRLATAYSGEHAHNLGTSLIVTLPTAGPDEFELRCFVKAASEAAAKATYPTATEVLSVTQAEGGWWFLRAKAKRSVSPSRTLSGAGCYVDDVAVFPRRNNGAPVSVSHYAYDRALGLVSSITGSNGRTTRYQYDKLGRLMKVYDVYGKPTAATRYGHAVAP